jgi:hypothetical protein
LHYASAFHNYRKLRAPAALAQSQRGGRALILFPSPACAINWHLASGPTRAVMDKRAHTGPGLLDAGHSSKDPKDAGVLSIGFAEVSFFIPLSHFCTVSVVGFLEVDARVLSLSLSFSILDFGDLIVIHCLVCQPNCQHVSTTKGPCRRRSSAVDPGARHL